MYGTQQQFTPRFYFSTKEGRQVVGVGGIDLVSFSSVKEASDLTQALNRTYNDYGGHRSDQERHAVAE